ncbi:hypothetical protein ATO13_23591 [Stappia sp. 22II-S9-Z10]|nr:hypothetical protein ATO13_23591 [Stappia sp. 22II-S9-Z10]
MRDRRKQLVELVGICMHHDDDPLDEMDSVFLNGHVQKPTNVPKIGFDRRSRRRRGDKPHLAPFPALDVRQQLYRIVPE